MAQVSEAALVLPLALAPLAVVPALVPLAVLGAQELPAQLRAVKVVKAEMVAVELQVVLAVPAAWAMVLLALVAPPVLAV